jgi:hypothetical protein
MEPSDKPPDEKLDLQNQASRQIEQQANGAEKVTAASRVRRALRMKLARKMTTPRQKPRP